MYTARPLTIRGAWFWDLHVGSHVHVSIRQYDEYLHVHWSMLCLAEKLYFCIYTCLRNTRQVRPSRRKRLDVILKRPYDLSLFLEVVLDLLDCVFASVELGKSSVSWVTPMLCVFFSVYSPFQHPTQHQSLSLQRRLRNGLGVPRHCLR